MAGYVIAQIQVNDREAYGEYVAGVGATIKAFEGEVLVAGAAADVMEGVWPLPSTVILRFPTIEKAKEWYHSDMYKPLLGLRLKIADSNLVIVDGV